MRARHGELTIAECRLGLGELRPQRERYQRLGVTAERVGRGPQTLLVEFTEAVDRELLEETIAVERDCCPFFALHYEPEARRLTVQVAEGAQDPALDALVSALGVEDVVRRHRG